MASHRIHMLLDRSGSMGSYRTQTIEAVNAYLATLRADGLARDTSFTLTTFDSESIDTVRRDERGSTVRDLSPREFVPRSATPLYDAVGYVLDVESRVRVPGRRAIVIVTDGAENGSRRLTEATVRARVETQENLGWIFIFLGANQNAAVEAAKVGVPEQRAISYRASSGKAAAATFAAAAALSFGYFMLKPGDAAAAATGFSEADRQAAFDGATDWEAEMMKDIDGAPSEPTAGPAAAAISDDDGLAAADSSLGDSEAGSGSGRRDDHAADVGNDTGNDTGNTMADAADGDGSGGSFFGSIASAIGSIFSAVTGGDSDGGDSGGDSGGDGGGD